MVALVMSGGGPVAVAWEAGLLAGLEGEGISFSDADLVLGTSAGAIVGAQLRCGKTAQSIAAAILDEARGIAPRGGTMLANPEALARLPSLFMKAQMPSPNPAATRAEIGAYSLSVAPQSEEAAIRPFSHMVGERWPDRPFGCAVVDAITGEVEVLAKDCGAPLAAAVAASCSLPGISPPITIAGRSYIDGGFASAANADLATGFREVVILAFHRLGGAAPRVIEGAERQAEKLRAEGARVIVIHPEHRCLALIGEDGMNFRARPAVAEAAITQGISLAAELARFLNPQE
jgi:NTE family protein